MEDKRLKYFKIAKELNIKFRKELKLKNAHFRGNIRGFSCVSLDEKTPELGIGRGGMKKPVEGIEKFLKNIHPPKRRTPEKELQAYIIRKALDSNKKLPIGKNITYVTSELVSYKKQGKKVVTDILALNEKNDLVVIELKSSRNKTKLINQVNDFEACINRDKQFFIKLVYLLTEKRWSGRVKKIIVWPLAKTSPRKWENENITEVCYLRKKYNGKKYTSYDFGIKGQDC
jgi:hypothetical protein